MPQPWLAAAHSRRGVFRAEIMRAEVRSLSSAAIQAAKIVPDLTQRGSLRPDAARERGDMDAFRTRRDRADDRGFYRSRRRCAARVVRAQCGLATTHSPANEDAVVVDARKSCRLLRPAAAGWDVRRAS